MQTGERIRRALRAFVPRHVSARGVLGFMELLRRLHRLPRRPARSPARSVPGAYIEAQRRYGELRYGRSTIRRAGCEVIAVYNALLALEGAAPPLESLAACFGRDGMVLAGWLGTAPGAARDFFRRQGYAVLYSVGEEIPGQAARCGAVILSVWNDRDDVRAGIHTVCCTPAPGGWTAHNVSGDGSVAPPCPALDGLVDTLWGGAGRLICLVGIEPKP